MPQIVGAAGQWGGRQGRAERGLAGGMPGTAVDRFAERAAAGAAEQPAIRGGAELADVLAEQADQDGGIGTILTVPVGRCLSPRGSCGLPLLVHAAAVRG